MTNEFRYFLKSNFVGVECQEYYLPKGIIKRYDVIINGKKIMAKQLIQITGQGEDQTNGCLLDYEYIKNHYRSIAVYLYKQEVLDGDPKAIRFANTIPTDIKFSIVQISEIIQSGSWLGNL